MKAVSILFFFIGIGQVKAQLAVEWYKNSEALSIYNPKKSVYNPIDSCIYTAGMYSGQFEMDGLSVSSTFPKAFFLMKTKQTGEIVWLKTVAENSYNVELSSNVSLSSDSLGKLLLGITFNGKLYHDVDSLVLPDDAFTTSSVLFKMNMTGDIEWYKQIFVSNLKAICTANNIIYTTGRNLNNDVFIMAHSFQGDSLWTRTGGSTSGDDIGENIITDETSIYVTGVIQPNNGVYFDTEHPTFVSPYFWGSFLAKYDIAGNIQWVRCFYAADFGEIAWIRAITVCDNKIILGGEFSGGLVKFFPSSMVLNSQNPSRLASFLLCYDTSGNKIWMKEHHNNYNGDCSIGKIINENNRCWVLTEFSGSVAVDNQDTISSLGNFDLNIDLIDLGGSSLWNNKLSGTNMDGATSFFKVENDLILNISTKSQSLLLDNTTMSLAPVSDQMVLVRFHVSTLGIPENKEDVFTVYPNPGRGSWNLGTSVDVSGEMLQVYNAFGQLIYQQVLGSGNTHLVNVELDPGIYFVKIAGMESEAKRLIIQ